MAWLLRFKAWLLSGKKSTHDTTLQVYELLAAEVEIVKYIQNTHYAEELRMLGNGEAISKKSSIYMLEPYMENDGVLRVTGRFRSASIPEASKHPAILPKEHHVCELIVRDAHFHITGHAGAEHILAVVRQTYWIPQIRPIIKIIIRLCILCQRLRGKLCMQRMADLPADRVLQGGPSFVYVGMDCFGPFLVKRGRAQLKRYGCLFTCLNMRAHREAGLP